MSPIQQPKIERSIFSPIYSFADHLISQPALQAAIITALAALLGASLGALIALRGQRIAINEARKQRAEDRKRSQQAQANSLLFKMVRIHSEVYSIHRHIEDCFARAENDGFRGEPWQFFLPLANPPQSIHFSSDEMSMLLDQKDNDTFNKIVSMDVIHNSLIDAIKVLNTLRTALTDKLTADAVENNVVSGQFSVIQQQNLRPKMMEVNLLVNELRAKSCKDFEESHQALHQLHKLLREKLGLTYMIETTSNPSTGPKKE